MSKAYWARLIGLSFAFLAFASLFSFSAKAALLYANITTQGGNPRALATIDTNTGLVTTIGLFGFVPQMGGITYVSSLNALFGIAPDPNDGALPSTLYQIDLGTGLATQMGNTGVPLMRGLQFDPISNQLFATTGGRPGGDPSLYTLDPLTGIPTLVGSLGLPAGVGGTNDLAFDPVMNVMYLSTSGITDAGQLHEGLNLINTGTGASTLIGTFGNSSANVISAEGIAYDPIGQQLLGVHLANPDQLQIIDTTTGAATAFLNLSVGGQISSHVVSLAFVPGSAIGIPEPSTLAIFAFGLAGLGFMGWRRRAA